MPVDASIPLQANVQAGNPQQTMSLLEFAQNMKAHQQQQQAQNALKSIFSDPNSMGPDGQPTQQAINNIMAIDPKTGMEVRQQQSELQARQAAMAKNRAQQEAAVLEQHLKKDDYIQRTVREPSLIAYDDAIKRGLSPAAAHDVAQAEYSKGIEEAKASGVFHEDEAQHLPTAFEFERVTNRSQSRKEYLAGEEKKAADKRAEDAAARAAAAEKEHERHDRQMESEFARRDERIARMQAGSSAGTFDATKTGDDFLKTLPANERSLVKDIAEGKITPTTLSTKGGHRENIMSKVAQYSPEYSQQDYGSEATALKKFTTGQQGNSVRSFNVSISHLNTLSGLADALQNGDVQVINRIGNEINKQTGKPAPTNFEAARQIVGDEIVKGIVGAGGGVADREKAQAAIEAAKSPQQLKGVIKTYQELMGGQLRGLRTQYEESTGRKDFERFLTPEAKTHVGDGSDPKGAQHPADIQDLLKKYGGGNGQ